MNTIYRKFSQGRMVPLLVVTVLVITVSNCKRVQAADDQPEEIRKVRVEPAVSVLFTETIRATGRLADRQQLRMSFKTGGVISSVLVDEGDLIGKGQILARLELDEINAQNQQANLSVEKARIDMRNAELALQLAERDFRNARGLYTDSVATREQLENAEVRLENARNQVEAARKGLRLSEQSQEVAAFNLKHATITAPSAGTVLAKLAEPGEIVGPGTPILLLGTKARTKVLRVDVTDRQMVQLSKGLPARVAFDAFPGQVFQGTIDELGAMADPYTGTYTIEVAVDAAGANLLSGLIGQVTLEGGATKELIQIPVDGLVTGDGKRGEVFVATNQKAVLKPVVIYRIEDEFLLVESGIQPGDQIITSGVGYLSDGMRVQIETR